MFPRLPPETERILQAALLNVISTPPTLPSPPSAPAATSLPSIIAGAGTKEEPFSTLPLALAEAKISLKTIVAASGDVDSTCCSLGIQKTAPKSKLKN